ncbi:amino acid permease [Leekyejoonella antrihumi]|nr:amino acid permease [Leekyejoonella antrihumi]
MGEVEPVEAAGARAPDEDERRLHEMGYAQELRRHMSAFSNFAVSFTIISVLSGCLTLYGYGLVTGGPAEIVWSWPIVGVLVLFVGLAMAEVCSSFPTAGGLYYFSAKLATPKNAPVVSWFTGWFNLLGEVAVTTGIDFGAALFLNAYLDLQFGFTATPPHTILLLACILILHGLLNTIGVSAVKLLSNISVWWHIIGVLVIVGVLTFVPSHHQSAGFVFTHFVNQTGWGSWIYVMFIGILLAQYTFTGYDASAHMSEETRNAAIAGPKGIVNSIWVSLLAGWLLLIGVTFAIQNYGHAVSTPTGVPPAQIFIDALGPTGGKLLLLIAIVAQLFCGMASVAANSRMIYAFSRDGAVPGHRLWHKVNSHTRTPTNAVWFAAVGAFILAIPYLWNSTAYAAVTSVAVIGLYIAYVVPSFLRFLRGDAFQRGPWNLGRWGRPVALIATIWVCIIVILFMLPTVSPVTASTFNYTVVAVLVVIGFAGIYWLVSARNWFTGPQVQGSEEELRAVEADLKKGAV